MALVIAAEKFDWSRGVKFTTYAYPCISGALINAEQEWMGYNRKAKDSLRFSPLKDDTDTEFVGMVEADLSSLASKFDGEWFARPARLYLIAGLEVAEVARLCGCRANTVHQSVSYYRKRLRAELVA